jgi:hypothetical protein
MNRRELLAGTASILASDRAEAFGIGRLGLGEGHLGALGRAVKASGLAPYLGQVATRAMVPNTNSGGGNRQMMNRTRHIAKSAITSLQVYFANWALTITTGVEVGGIGTAVITGSIEYPVGTFTQLKFGGATSNTMADGGFALSDAANVIIPAGAAFFIRSYFVGAAGIIFTTQHGNGFVGDTANGEAMTYAASGVADQTMSGTVTNTAGANAGVMYAPCAILGQTTSPSVFIFGDSRSEGIHDSYDNVTPTAIGEVARAVSQNFAYINSSISASTIQNWLTSNTRQLNLAQYCSHVICQYGVNDIANSARTAAQVIADRQTARSLFAGKKFFHTTLPPEVTTSNGYIDLAGQTVSATNGVRVTFNDTVRLGVSGMDGYFDLASIAESSLDSGKWIFNGTVNYATTDGTHETPAMNNLYASSGIIPATAFGGAGVTYVGPGNVVSSWLAWYGLRAYSAAYATGSNPAIDIQDQAGANPLTVNILANGNLDVASINTWVTAHSVTTIKISKVYDQSGNARHATQSSLGAMPTLVLGPVTGLTASRPAMHFAAASTQTLVFATAVTQAQPLSMSSVYQRTNVNTGFFNTLIADSTAVGFLLPPGTNLAGEFAGSSVSVAAADNAFHKIQGLLNGASSALFLDGTNTGSLSAGASGFTGTLAIGNDTSSRYLDGYICEVGAIGGDKSANFAALDSNQHSYWGV